jgi:hypothetical protein
MRVEDIKIEKSGHRTGASRGELTAATAFSLDMNDATVPKDHEERHEGVL